MGKSKIEKLSEAYWLLKRFESTTKTGNINYKNFRELLDKSNVVEAFLRHREKFKFKIGDLVRYDNKNFIIKETFFSLSDFKQISADLISQTGEIVDVKIEQIKKIKGA
jgi:hypothetical protein